MNTDLFGQPLPDPLLPTASDPVPDRRTNSIDEVLTVLGIACSDGYAVVGARHQVWRCLSDPLIEPVPRHEADTVRQLLDTGWLTLGGTHIYEHHSADVTARSVLIPQRVRHWMLRQNNYKQLGQLVRGGR